MKIKTLIIFFLVSCYVYSEESDMQKSLDDMYIHNLYLSVAKHREFLKTNKEDLKDFRLKPIKEFIESRIEEKRQKIRESKQERCRTVFGKKQKIRLEKLREKGL